MQSRDRLKQYCKTLLKFEPDYVFTHVTRLVPSKGLWRDLRVLEHVDALLRERNETAVLFTLSTEVPGRRQEDVLRMDQRAKVEQYGDGFSAKSICWTRAIMLAGRRVKRGAVSEG